MLQYPEPTEEDYKLPLRFRYKMKKLFEKHDHPVWYYTKKTAAIVILLFGMFAGIFLDTNANARARILGWVWERIADNRFHYQNLPGDAMDISDYTLEGKVPDGYQLIKKSGDEFSEIEYYKHETKGFINLWIFSPAYDGDLYIGSDEDKVDDPVFVDKIKADLYISNEPGENNVITWQNKDGVRFLILAPLDGDLLIELAERIE